MKRRFVFVATCGLLLISMAVSSCSSSAADDRAVEVQGILLLKGNEPHVHWVLEVSDTEHWELRGLNDSSARALQAQRVKVKGLIRPDIRSALLLPTLEVVEFGPLAK